MKGFHSCYAYIEGKGIIRTAIGWQHGTFCALDTSSSYPTLDERYILLPGFIEQHVHGAGGADTMQGTNASLQTIADTLASQGTTAFLATTMTMEEEKMNNALQAIAHFKTQQSSGARCLGAHVEGPFIAKEKCGAQKKENCMRPSVKTLQTYMHASSYTIRMMTFASELCDDADFYRVCQENNIVISLGHSQADAKQTFEAIEQGASCATHLFNAMPNFHHREVGLVGACLLDSRMYCECIADMEHLSKETLQLVYRLKKEKMILISDSMEARGLKEGNYQLGGQAVFVHNGKATLKDGTLAGSIIDLRTGVKNAMNAIDISLEEAVDMATIAPARLLGIDAQKGSIAIGKDADFIIVDKDLTVYATYVEGNPVYKKAGWKI